MRTSMTSKLAAFALAPVLVAWPAAMNTMSLETGSTLSVKGTSTVRSFECKASALEARVETVGPGAAVAVVAGEKAVIAAAVDVPAAKLDCSNGTMNDHMRKALKAKENPVIGFRVVSYDLARATAGTTVTMAGELALGGVTKPITVTATATETPDGMLRVAGTHEIKMTEFGLKPPSLMMGTMKVGDKVTVGFDLLLKDR
ncbi:MAG TPA: YceI family protein [Gemmatimonadaceae bacterium]